MSTGNQDFTKRTKLREPMEEQWLEWELISHAVVTVSRIFFRESFRHFLVHKLEVWEGGPYLTCLLVGEEGSLVPSRCLRIFPSQMKVPTITLSIFPEDSCLPHQVQCPCQEQWLVAGPAASGPGPLRHSGHPRCLIKPLGQCLSHSMSSDFFLMTTVSHPDLRRGCHVSLSLISSQLLPSVFLSHSLWLSEGFSLSGDSCISSLLLQVRNLLRKSVPWSARKTSSSFLYSLQLFLDLPD